MSNPIIHPYSNMFLLTSTLATQPLQPVIRSRNDSIQTPNHRQRREINRRIAQSARPHSKPLSDRTRFANISRNDRSNARRTKAKEGERNQSVLRRVSGFVSGFWGGSVSPHQRMVERIKRQQSDQFGANEVLSRKRRSATSSTCYDTFTDAGVIKATRYKVNTHVSNWQYHPSSQRLTSGKTLVTWISKSQGSGAKYKAYGQLLSPEGKKVGEEFFLRELPDWNWKMNHLQALPEDKVALFHQKNIDGPSPIEVTVFDTKSKTVEQEFSMGSDVISYGHGTCALENGGLVSVYQDSSGSIYVQMNSSQGTKLLEKEISLVRAKGQEHLDFLITPLSNGNFVIAYKEEGGVKGKIFSPTFRDLDRSFIACSVFDEELPEVFLNALPNGNFLITCLKDDDDSSGIHGEIFSPTGQATGKGFDVDTGPFTSISYSLTTTPVGDIVVVWDKKVNYATQNIKLQAFSSTSEGKSREVSIPSENARHLKNPTISYLQNGTVFVGWQQGEMDVFGQSIVLADLLTTLPKENAERLAQKCLNDTTSLDHALTKEKQETAKLTNNLYQTRRLCALAEEAYQRDRTSFNRSITEAEEARQRDRASFNRSITEKERETAQLEAELSKVRKERQSARQGEKNWTIASCFTSSIALISFIANGALSFALRRRNCMQALPPPSHEISAALLNVDTSL